MEGGMQKTRLRNRWERGKRREGWMGEYEEDKARWGRRGPDEERKGDRAR